MQIGLVEGHMGKLHFSCDQRQDHRLLRLPDRGLFIVKLPDPSVRGKSRGKAVGKPAKHFHGPYNVHGIGDKSAEISQGHFSVPDKKAAKQQDNKRQKLGDQGKIGMILYKEL